MQHTLVTGMSATGKSTVVADLVARGVAAVDLDDARWSHQVPDDSAFADGPDATDWRWREDAVAALLDDAPEPLVVAGTSTNQGAFADRFAHVVLLSVPDDLALLRLATRTTNDYGKDPAEVEREVALRGQVQPLLRRASCLEVDTAARDRDAVVDALLAHLAGPACRRGPS